MNGWLHSLPLDGFLLCLYQTISSKITVYTAPASRLGSFVRKIQQVAQGYFQCLCDHQQRTDAYVVLTSFDTTNLLGMVITQQSEVELGQPLFLSQLTDMSA